MRILVAEDDNNLSDIYASLFKKEGYEVDIAKNGVEALEILKGNPPDLLLLDLNMPVKDGFEVLEERQGNAALSAIPVIVLTGLDAAEHVERTRELGVSEHFDKKIVELKPLLDQVERLTKAKS